MAVLNLARQDNSRCYVKLNIDMLGFAIQYYKKQGYIVLSFLVVDTITTA